jgi:hypothetical protein
MLSVRALNAIRGALAHHGIEYPEENPNPALAAQISIAEFLREPNCGRVTVTEIADWVREHGFELRYHSDRSRRFFYEIADIEQKITDLEAELERFRHLRSFFERSDG